jgi:hypothetical protein
MMKKCLDEKLLQAYIDGELSHELTAEAAAHIAACEACAKALAEVENESAFFAAAFAPDERVNVPTEVLRARINASVAQLESSSERNDASTRGWSFSGFLASLSGLFTFTPQGAVAFASVLAVLVLAFVFFVVKRSQPAPTNNQVAQNEINKPSTTTPGGGNSNINNGASPSPTAEVENPKVVSTSVNNVPRSPRKVHGGGSVKLSLPKEQLLPGEKQYQTAIASLEKTIKMGGDAVLRPSVRVEYERNIALLDSAIGETRRVAIKNPKDKDAVGFLMATYQSKVELLTKVADQAQVAALGR